MNWTPEQAAEHLATYGIVWDLGQIPRATARHLSRIARKERAMWPGYYVGTIAKACWVLS